MTPAKVFQQGNKCLLSTAMDWSGPPHLLEYPEEDSARVRGAQVCPRDRLGALCEIGQEATPAQPSPDQRVMIASGLRQGG